MLLILTHHCYNYIIIISFPKLHLLYLKFTVISQGNSEGIGKIQLPD